MAKDKPLTDRSTVGAWLKHPVGGPLIRQMLAEGGVDEKVLTPVKLLPLKNLVAMSGGQMQQSVVDELVLKANSDDPAVIAAIVGSEPAAPSASEAPQAASAADDDDYEPEPWDEVITPGRFAGKTVIVTGAASGIGRATASRIAREGGRVVAVDISAERLDEFAAELPDAEIVTVAGDITKQESVDAIVAAAGKPHRRPRQRRRHQRRLLAAARDERRDVGPRHRREPHRRVQAQPRRHPRHAGRPQGSIVNVASEAGLRGNASGNAYTVSKHGVIGLTRSAAFMYGPRGHPRERGRPGRRRHRHPVPAARVGVGSGAAAPVPDADPHAGDRGAARRIDHVPAVGRRRQHQRSDPGLRRRLVDPVTAYGVINACSSAP